MGDLIDKMYDRQIKQEEWTSEAVAAMGKDVDAVTILRNYKLVVLKMLK